MAADSGPSAGRLRAAAAKSALGRQRTSLNGPPRREEPTLLQAVAAALRQHGQHPGTGPGLADAQHGNCGATIRPDCS